MAEAETPATSYPDDGTMCRLPFLSACQPPRHSAGVSTSQVNARPDDRVPVWLIRAVCMTDHHAFHRASCVGMLSPPRTFSHHRPRPIAHDLKAFAFAPPRNKINGAAGSSARWQGRVAFLHAAQNCVGAVIYELTRPAVCRCVEATQQQQHDATPYDTFGRVYDRACPKLFRAPELSRDGASKWRGFKCRRASGSSGGRTDRENTHVYMLLLIWQLHIRWPSIVQRSSDAIQMRSAHVQRRSPDGRYQAVLV
jgi:hypothetical protein